MKRILLILFLLIQTSYLQGFFGEHSAVKAYHSGEYDAALLKFEALLTEEPDDPQLNYNAGKAAFKAQEYAAAASYFSQAVKQPEIPEALATQAWFDLGNAQVKQKKWQDAIDSYEHVLLFQPEHKEAQDMIEKIKKLLEEQKKQEEKNQQQNGQNDQSQDNDQQQDNNEQQDNEQQKNNQQQQNKEQQKQQDKQKQKSQDKTKNQQNNESQQGENDQQESEQNGQQDQSKNDKNQQSSQDKKSDDAREGSQDNKSQSNEQEQGKGSDQNEQDGKSSQDGNKKQNLDNKDTKKSGEQVGDKGQADKAEKDLQQDRGDDLENAVPDIQDHQRKENSMDHSASPTQDHSQPKKQDTPVSAKVQAHEADPFTIDDGIDKNSREGKLLQFIESRDAQAAQQLLKMNVQTQRKPGEKNW